MKQKKRIKRVAILCVFCFALLLIVEILLRVCWGFGKMPLYLEDEDYEYIYAPNQKMKRFGLNFYTNSFSQRSDEPSLTKEIILGLGDSVINGGSQTDNDSLATTIVTNETKYQMLNISAGSWGPDNVSAYLERWGCFNAKAMFVLLSSHDYGDIMDFSPVVGIAVSFPKKQYPCALSEVFCRYLLPRLNSGKKVLDPDGKVLKGIDKGVEFNPGWDRLKSISEKEQIPMIVILHADLSELRAGRYNEKGNLIEAWANNNSIRLIKDIEYLSEVDYRDDIHINSSGQRVIADIVKHELLLMDM